MCRPLGLAGYKQKFHSVYANNSVSVGTAKMSPHCQILRQGSHGGLSTRIPHPVPPPVEFLNAVFKKRGTENKEWSCQFPHQKFMTAAAQISPELIRGKDHAYFSTYFFSACNLVGNSDQLPDCLSMMKGGKTAWKPLLKSAPFLVVADFNVD